MTKENVLNNLIKLVGQDFDENDIITAFEDYEECGVSDVIVSATTNNKYLAYINHYDSVVQFQISTEIKSDNDTLTYLVTKVDIVAQ